MSVSSYKLRLYKNGIYSFNLYTTKAEAIKNNTDSNTSCFTIRYGGQTLYAATNNQASYPETSVLKFYWNGVRYIHKDTIIQKTVYYDPENPSDVHDDYRTYSRVKYYSGDLSGYTQEQIQNLYNEHSDWFHNDYRTDSWTTTGYNTVWYARLYTDVYGLSYTDKGPYNTEQEAINVGSQWTVSTGLLSDRYSVQQPYTIWHNDNAYTITVYDKSKVIDVHY